jgi:hypothetical protein
MTQEALSKDTLELVINDGNWADIIYPRLVRLLYRTASKGTHRLRLNFAEVVYENHDSRRHIKRNVRITPREVTVVHYYGVGRGQFNEAYLLQPGLEPQLLSINRRHVVCVDVDYVTVNGVDIAVRDGRPVPKPSDLKVTLDYDAATHQVYATGDTYFVKCILVKYGFHWSGGRWVKDTLIGGEDYDVDYQPVAELVKALRAIGVNLVDNTGG